MPSTSFVRSSRAGDRFHYYWASRRCLLLLELGARLKSVSIEGASPLEGGQAEDAEAGETVIDIAEYEGSERLGWNAL